MSSKIGCSPGSPKQETYMLAYIGSKSETNLVLQFSAKALVHTCDIHDRKVLYTLSMSLFCLDSEYIYMYMSKNSANHDIK